VIEDFKEEASVRLQQAKEAAARAARAADHGARETREFVTTFVQNVRRRRGQLTLMVGESKSRLRRAWKKITWRSPAPSVVPVFSSGDFMESLFQRSMDAKLHALLQLRTAARLGCELTTEARSEACLLQGWDPELIRAARNGSDLGFSERESLLLRYADDITRTPIDVDLQVFRQLRRHFTHDQIVEITTTICYENFRTRFRNAMGVEAGVPEESESTPVNGTPANNN
jgi:alkylhydroperoxidase family enzyme